MDATQEAGIANRILNNQTALGLSTLDGRVEVLERQGRFLLNQQEQESNTWHNIMFNLCEEVQEGERKTAILQDLLDVQRRLNQQLCLNFNKACQEMVAALKVAYQERKKRQAMRRELDELKEEFLKLKGMVHTAAAMVNIQNDSFPTAHIVDIFGIVIIFGPQMLWEIPLSPIPLLWAFLSQPVIIMLSVSPLGSSPQLLCLLIEDLTVGVGAMVEEFKEAVEHEVEMDAMVEPLIKSEEEPLTNNPDAVGELCEARDLTLDTSLIEGDFEDRYDGGGIV